MVTYKEFVVGMELEDEFDICTSRFIGDKVKKDIINDRYEKMKNRYNE